jgi:hypothetical protein
VGSKKFSVALVGGSGLAGGGVLNPWLFVGITYGGGEP